MTGTNVNFWHYLLSLYRAKFHFYKSDLSDLLSLLEWSLQLDYNSNYFNNSQIWDSIYISMDSTSILVLNLYEWLHKHDEGNPIRSKFVLKFSCKYLTGSKNKINEFAYSFIFISFYHFKQVNTKNFKDHAKVAPVGSFVNEGI